jgi:hypothetical protein
LLFEVYDADSDFSSSDASKLELSKQASITLYAYVYIHITHSNTLLLHERLFSTQLYAVYIICSLFQHRFVAYITQVCVVTVSLCTAFAHTLCTLHTAHASRIIKV